MHRSLAPGLLLAAPDLADPHFRRAVVLLVQHDAEGAFGFNVNLRLDLTVRLICEDVGLTWPKGHPSPPAFFGGPVAPQQGFVLHPRDVVLPDDERVGDGLAFTRARGALEAWVADPEVRWRLLLGYAGWGAGQLDGELARGSWVAAPLEPEVLLGTPPEALWETSLARLGVTDLARLDTSSQHVH